MPTLRYQKAILTGLLAQVGIISIQATEDPSLKLPPVWDSTFQSILSELVPDQIVIVTIYKSSNNLLVGMSRSGLPQKWFSFLPGQTRLKPVEAGRVKEIKSLNGISVIYESNTYLPVAGFGRFPPSPIVDTDHSP